VRILARFIAGLILVALLLNIAAPAARSQSAPEMDTSQWTLFRSDRLGFEVKYTDNWRAQMPTGTGSESVLISEPRQANGSHSAIQFWVQRKINAKGLAIDIWYADQIEAIASLPVSTHTVLGTRPAIRREVVGSLGNHFDWFTSLNTTDVFEVTITQPVEEKHLNPIYDAILTTLKFIL